MNGPTVSRVDVPGAVLVCDEVGQGPPLVLVHGTGAQASTWGRTVADLAAGGHRVLAYDRRGYGHSTHAPVRDYRVHVRDLAAVITHVGAPAAVLGWSSGGNTALALSLTHPELLTSIVVMEAPWHGLRHATPSLLAALGRAKLDQVRGRREKAAAAFFRWASRLRDGSNGFDTAPAAARAELLGNAAVVLAELDPHPFGLMMEQHRTSALASTGVPTTWLLSAESRDWYRGLQARVVAAAPQVRTEWIAHAGHLAHAEQPEAFAAAVLHSL